ncbi:aldo/keto reductase [Fusibacter paucivorans]|uniref:Aldo/keto reductase n=1 Tax=Fusibacter paucivorans TaxID=76009 RepID=A0ABS5PMZ4_9FIRM|nr:aldo/keto reductase [Fusibacter paucivorans]MBS7525422.1 aldo/keto reductase [Fusibacter paucivorans]
MTYLGEDIRKLGFGLMRLPKRDGEIDIEQTKAMVDVFMAEGMTYFDTAYGYDNGKSEEAAKIALVDRYPRDSFQLATKLPAWAGAKSAEEARQMFWTSLERTGAGYFDFFLLHNLGDDRTKCFDDYDIWTFLETQKSKGLIKHLGFSFHDKAAVLDNLLTKHPEMEFVQLQINYADWESYAIESRKCYEVARKHGKPIIIMEPVKGGLLASLPKGIDNYFLEYAPTASVASWAVRFAASLESIITVLSGMSSIEQMQDNLSYMKSFKPLVHDERQIIEKVQKELDKIDSIPCTDCQYCMKDCPEGIPIPKIFDAVNLYYIYDDLSTAKRKYGFATYNSSLASQCIACGQCETACPQHIQIIEALKQSAVLLET